MFGKLDYSALGQAIDTTWGRTSTPFHHTQSVKVDLIGEDCVRVKYMAVINFGNSRSMRQEKQNHKNQAQAVHEAALKKVSSVYKKLCGDSLSYKQVKQSETESIEVTSLAVHNPKKTALYRFEAVYELS